MPFGADYANASTEFFSEGEQSLDDEQEKRVTITDPSRRFLNGQILQPLQDTFGVLFPYTPSITINHAASYDSTPLTHANYEQPFYQHSTVSSINVSGNFTAANYDEAKYILAVIHFFRSVTKMFYGQDSLAGTPPPILFLDGYGQAMLNHIPVVVTSFQTQLPDNVDYISTQAGGNYTNVPTEMRIAVDLKPVYSRNQISNNFGLEKYASGQLLASNGFGQSGPGGFI